MEYARARQLLWIPDGGRTMGVHIMGSKGTGKSRLLGRVFSWFDFRRNFPLVLFDPDGSAIDNFLDKVLRLPPEKQDEACERILYVNVSGMGGSVIPMPLLVRHGSEQPFEISQRYVDVVRRVDPALETASIEGWNAFLHVGTRVGMALSALGFQITEATALVADPSAYRQKLEERAAKDSTFRDVVSFLKPPIPHAQSYLNKVGIFTLDRSMRAMFGASTPGIDWQRVVSDNIAVLLDFRDEANMETRRFKLLWLYRELVSFVERRGEGRHKPISIIVDELPYFLSFGSDPKSLLEKDLADLVQRVMRKYSLWLTLCHTELFQLSPFISRNLMSLGTQIIGSTTDLWTGQMLAERFYPYDPTWIKRSEPVFRTLSGASWVDHEREMEFTPSEQARLKSRQFFTLPKYRFLAAVSPEEGKVGERLTRIRVDHIDEGQFPDKDRVFVLRQALMKRHGRDIADIEREIAQRTRQGPVKTETTRVATS